MKMYVTFGQDHAHRIGNNTLDKDCVAIVSGNRESVFKLFGAKFSMVYPEDHWDKDSMKYFPRGYIEI
jgi:hypothetical protein